MRPDISNSVERRSGADAPTFFSGVTSAAAPMGATDVSPFSSAKTLVISVSIATWGRRDHMYIIGRHRLRRGTLIKTFSIISSPIKWPYDVTCALAFRLILKHITKLSASHCHSWYTDLNFPDFPSSSIQKPHSQGMAATWMEKFLWEGGMQSLNRHFQ